MAEHVIVKPEKLVRTAVGMLEQELIIPNLFTKRGVDDFKGADDDTISVVVEGVLPYRTYAWRNDRSSGIVFDEYAERKVPVTFGGNFYSAVKLTDEQNDFDLDSWAKLLRPQVKAVARGLGRGAVDTLVDQEYEVTLDLDSTDPKPALIKARQVLNSFHTPSEDRYMLVGTDVEALLLNDDTLNLAQNVGDSEAESALRNGTIGRRFGFDIVVDQTIPADHAYAFSSSGFIFLSGAPSVPQSVPFGATTSFEGIALRWVRDYDSERMQDRSVVNTYAGFRAVEDVLVGWNGSNEEVVSEEEYFVRGIELVLDGTESLPEGELADITGVGTPTESSSSSS